MVNEVVMYQSMFLLGVIMFGFFAFTFNNYSDFAESITLDNNLERVLQEVGEELLDLLDRAAELQGSASTVDITVRLTLDAEYANEAYIIGFGISTTGIANLTALVKGEIISSLSLSYVDGTSAANGEVDFSGQMASSSADPQIRYTYDGTTTSVIFSS